MASHTVSEHKEFFSKDDVAAMLMDMKGYDELEALEIIGEHEDLSSVCKEQGIDMKDAVAFMS